MVLFKWFPHHCHQFCKASVLPITSLSYDGHQEMLDAPKLSCAHGNLFHMYSQTSPLSASELSLAFSCRTPPRRLCPLGNLLVSIGGLLLGPPKALSSPPTSSVPSGSPCPEALPAEQSPAWHAGPCPCRDQVYVRGRALHLAVLSLWRLLSAPLQPMCAPLRGGFDHQCLDYTHFSDWISVDLLPISTLSQFLNSNLLASLLIVSFSIQIKL